MKIAIIAHLKYAIAEPFAGGLEMHTHLLSRQLAALGHSVTLFAAGGSDGRLGVWNAGPPTGVPNDMRTQEAIALAEHNAYGRILSAIEQGGFDVVHNNSLHYLPLTQAHRMSAPMLTTLHTPPFLELENGVLDRSRTDLRFVGVSHALRRMWSGTIACDEVIYNGIDLERFVPATEAPCPAHAIWYGRLVPEKGAHLAIAAARKARVALRLVGPRSDETYWREMIEPALGGGIVYLGHLNHTALAAEIAAAAVALVTPRWEEPFGLVVAEALACGTPVAGFVRGALPELLDSDTGCLAAPDDVDGLARALVKAARLSRKACRSLAEARCDGAVMVRAYESLYQRMAAPLRLAAE